MVKRNVGEGILRLAPICLFVFNRPNHTIKVLDALRLNKLALNSDLFIFSDGPRNDQDIRSVSEVREMIAGIDGFKNVRLIERNCNYGLANNIISGVSEVLRLRGRAIILEDDLLVSPYFLDYMNEGLELFSDCQDVASIHGYSYPTSEDLPEVFFLRGADCWGWGVWERSWVFFEKDASKLYDAIVNNGLQSDFDFDGTYPYTDMLKQQAQGRLNSWAIRWYASAFLKNMLTLYPGKSLVENIGFDGSGTNCGEGRSFDVKIHASRCHVGSIPIEHSTVGFKAFAKYFLSLKKKSSKIERVKAIRKFLKSVLRYL